MPSYKILFIGLCLVLFANSCSKKEEEKNLNQGNKTFTYYNNSKIDTTAGNTINTGNFTVFEYNYVHPDDPGIADDEVSDKIIFQIPAAQTSFSIADDQIKSATFKRWRYCFCFFIGPYPNIGGSISGVKRNNSWIITGNIKASTTENIDISGTYMLK